METKLFEIRDRGMFITALGIKLDSETEAERYLLARAGYGIRSADHRTFVLLSKLDGGLLAIANDAYSWNNRTMRTAHLEISRNWPTLPSGSVIDVEYILGETKEPKQSEALAHPVFDLKLPLETATA